MHCLRNDPWLAIETSSNAEESELKDGLVEGSSAYPLREADLALQLRREADQRMAAVVAAVAHCARVRVH